MPQSYHPTGGGSQKETKILLFISSFYMGRGHLKKGARRKEVAGARGSQWNRLGFWGCSGRNGTVPAPLCTHCTLLVQLQPLMAPRAPGSVTPTPLWTQHCCRAVFFHVQTKDINCNDLVCSLVIPAVSLKLFGFISRVRVWRSWINNKSLFGITHVTALNGKTQAGACESYLKIFILQFMQWKGDEPPLQPLCRKGCLNHGLAPCFTHMKRWGFARVSWEHWSPRIYLSVSAFVPSVLPRDTQWGTATHKVMGQFCHLGTETTVRKENARRWLEQLWLVLGSSGLSQEGTCPTAQEGKWEKGLCHLPAHPWVACTVQTPGTRLLLGARGVWSVWKRSFIYRTGKAGAGLEVLRNNCATFFLTCSIFTTVSLHFLKQVKAFRSNTEMK